MFPPLEAISKPAIGPSHPIALKVSKPFVLCFLVVAWVGFILPAVARADKRCERTESITFRCVIGACEESITVSRCRSLTRETVFCDTCGFKVPCCGQNVCSASSTTELCSGGDGGPGVPMEVRNRHFYIPSCAGGFVSAQHVLEGNESPAPASTTGSGSGT